MSKYTTNFKTLIESGLYSKDDILNVFKDYNLTDYLTQSEIDVINNRSTWNKEKLAKKIFNHYYLEEIGFETFAEFSIYAKSLMNEIMEEKLPLIYSQSIEYDPLVNVDFKETFSREVNSEDSATADGLVLNSDTPQGRTTKTEILSGKYVSNTSGNESSSSGTSNSQETYEKHTKGNSGVLSTAQKLIEQYRNNIISIDRDIIKELNILFMGLF